MALRSYLLLLAATTVLTSTVAAAGTASGKFTLDGEDYSISAVLAKTEQDPDEAKKDVAVLLTDTVVTLDQFNISTLYQLSMAGKVHGVIVTFNEEQQCTRLVILGVAQRSGSRVCNFTSTQFDTAKIAGKASVSLQESSGHQYEFSAQFESPVMDAVEKPVNEVTGNQLPAGGGEPGKAYLEYDRAIQSGNIGALKKFAPSDEAADQLDTAEAKKAIEMMKAMRATDLKVTKGFISGDRALLIVEGKDAASGGLVTATVSMIKSGNRWKVENENWKEQ